MKKKVVFNSVIKHFVAILLVTSIMLSSVACENKQKEQSIELYSTYITDKVLQDHPTDEKLKQIASFNISASKGEKEGAQVVIKPSAKVKDYKIILQNLTNENGDIFSADNLTVYNQKYITTTTGSKGINSILGSYPDILLPMQTAIEYGENYIEAGNNQAIIVEANIPSTQAAGNYKGNFTIKIDGKDYIVPSNINVWNINISETVNTGSIFLINREDLILGELDNSLEMYKKYVDKLLEYRISPFLLPAEANNYEDFALTVKEYYGQKKFSTYCIPPSYVADTNNPNLYYVDKAKLKGYLTELVSLSIADNFNYLDKASAYYGVIDEPELNGLEERAEKFCENYKLVINQIADELKADEAIVGENKTELIASVRNIKNIVTNKYTDSINDSGQVWCPTVDEFDSGYNREKYESDEQVWWYTCNNPVNPYPSYHIDDKDGFLSSRLMSWMQEIYNVDGFLYWETVFYKKATNINGKNENVHIDLYKEPNRCVGTNGEGFLFYPGAPYGIDGPVVSNRLMSIRDGLEEYELLRALEEKYTKIGLSSDSIINLICETLYSGTVRACDSKSFAFAREALATLLEMSENSDFYIYDVKEAQESVKLFIKAKTQEALSFNNNALEPTSEQDGFKLFVAQTNMTNSANNVTLGLGQNILTLMLGGKREVVESFETDISAFKADSNVEFESAPGAEFDKSGKVLKTTFSVGEYNKRCSYRPTNISDIVNKNTQSVSFMIYNPKREKVGIRLSLEGNIVLPITEENLHYGWNKITLTNVYAYKWNLLKSVKGVRFTLIDNYNDPLTLVFDEIIKTAVQK